MQGQVEKVSRPKANGKPTWLLIDGEWYSTFEKLPCQEGDLVEFTFETKKGKSNGKEYKNIKSLALLDQGREDEGSNPQARNILRSVALKSAARVSQDPAEVLEIAGVFYEWLIA